MTGHGNKKKEIRRRNFLLNVGEIHDKREKDREGEEIPREGRRRRERVQ